MLLRRIHILVPQHIRHQINIPCLLIQCGSVCAAQLMRRNLLGSCDLTGVLLHKVLNGLHPDPFPLSRIKQRMLMPGQRRDPFPHLQVPLERVSNLLAKVNSHLVAALSCHRDSVILKIDVLNIQSDTFRHTDSGSQK